jgi:hypothetical protein
MTIDVGHSLGNGLFVAGPWDNYDHPDAWWIGCGKGHRTFATNDMIEAGTVSCKECSNAAAAYARLQAMRKEADQLLAAGRGNDQAYEDLIAAERGTNDKR